MLNKQKAAEIIKQFVTDILPGEEWYRLVRPEVKAIILYGSVAKGTNKPDSDIDILLILPLETEEKYTTGEYFYDSQGYKINIVLRSIERLRKIAREHRDEQQKAVFENAEIVSSIDNEVKLLLQKIKTI